MGNPFARCLESRPTLLFFERFMQALIDVSEQSVAGSKNTVIHIRNKFSFRFSKRFKNFIGKSEKFPFHLIGI